MTLIHPLLVTSIFYFIVLGVAESFKNYHKVRMYVLGMMCLRIFVSLTVWADFLFVYI